jgi:WD40 repeat protein
MKHVAPISGIASHNNQFIATAGYDNRVILWDALNNKPIAMASHDHLANQCDFSPNGDYLVTASSDYSARVWKLPEMRLSSLLSGHIDDVEMARFSPCGQKIATASRDYTTKIFSLSGSELLALKGHTADVISVTWSKDGSTLYTSSDDGTIRIWDANSGSCRQVLELGDVETDTLVIFDNGMIVAGNDEGELVVILGSSIQRYPVFAAGIKRVVCDTKRNLVLALSYDRTMKLFVCEGPELKLKFEEKIPNIIWPRSAAFLGDDEIVFATFGDTYATYQISSKDWSIKHIGPTLGVNAVTSIDDKMFTIGDAGILKADTLAVSTVPSLCNFLCSDGEIILTGGQDGKVYNARSAEILYTNRSPLNCGATFIKQGERYFIVGTYTGEGLLFKRNENQIEFIQVLPLLNNAVKGVSASDKYIFAVGAAGDSVCLAIESFQVLWACEKSHTKIANGCAFVDGNIFASISRDLSLRFFDVSSQTVEEVKTPHSNSVKCISVDPTGRFVATGSYAGFVAIYDRELKQWIDIQRFTTFGISTIHFDKASWQFLCSSYDGNVYIKKVGSYAN